MYSLVFSLLVSLCTKNATFGLNSSTWHHNMVNALKEKSRMNVKLPICFTSLKNHRFLTPTCVGTSLMPSNIVLYIFPIFIITFSGKVSLMDVYQLWLQPEVHQMIVLKFEQGNTFLVINHHLESWFFINKTHFKS